MKHLIKPLKWREENLFIVASTPMYEYRIDENNGKYEVDYTDLNIDTPYVPYDPATGFTTLEQAKKWAFDHHCEKMLPLLSLDLLNDYVAKFTQWSKDRRIIQNGNLQTQTLKLVSEIGELADNIAKGRCTKDDIGDCFVVLNNLVEMQGYTWQECLEQAWNDIKDRKGYMNENGVFIKEGDTDN